jgi:hypothetical protein
MTDHELWQHYWQTAAYFLAAGWPEPKIVAALRRKAVRDGFST